MQPPKITKRVFIFIFTSVILFLVNILLTSIFPSEKLINFFESTLKLKWVILVFVILSLLIAFLTEYIIKYRKSVRSFKPLISKQNYNYCDIIEELNARLYDEDFKYVDSIQLYKYRNFNDNHCSHIQCNFIGGVVKQGYELNAIQQTYFDFPHNLYKKIDKIADAYRIFKGEDEQKKSILKSALKEKIENVMEDIAKELDKLNTTNKLNEEAYSLYRMFNCYLGLPEFNLNIDLNILDENLKESLNIEKRNNILGAILLDNLYIFQNENSSSKKNRLYFTFPFLTKNHIIVVGTLNLALMNDDVDILNVCKSISEKILGVKHDN